MVAKTFAAARDNLVCNLGRRHHHGNRLEVHRPLHITRMIPTANRRRAARLAERMLIGPKTSVAPQHVERKSRCCSTSQSRAVAAFLHYVWRTNEGAGSVQPTQEAMRLHCAAGHGPMKHGLSPSSGKGMKGGPITACCSIFRISQFNRVAALNRAARLMV